MVSPFLSGIGWAINIPHTMPSILKHPFTTRVFDVLSVTDALEAQQACYKECRRTCCHDGVASVHMSVSLIEFNLHSMYCL